jgi:hypothetical protein
MDSVVKDNIRISICMEKGRARNWNEAVGAPQSTAISRLCFRGAWWHKRTRPSVEWVSLGISAKRRHARVFEKTVLPHLANWKNSLTRRSQRFSKCRSVRSCHDSLELAAPLTAAACSRPRARVTIRREYFEVRDSTAHQEIQITLGTRLTRISNAGRFSNRRITAHS